MGSTTQSSHHTMSLPVSSSHPYLSEAQQSDLCKVARALSRPGGGILAADETPKAMEQRFASLKIENTAEMRRKYRQLLFSCPADRLRPLSGVILQHEKEEKLELQCWI